jgi:hypothetical protein
MADYPRRKSLSLEVEFQLYDQKGRPFVEGLSYYKDETGRLIRVPSMFGPKKQIMNYLRVCFETGIGVKFNEDRVVGYLEEFWVSGEENMKKILEMLDSRALELKRDGSIRHLLYSKTREILSKLTIPIFNRQQLENISNIPDFIVDEIGKILGR